LRRHGGIRMKWQLAALAVIAASLGCVVSASAKADAVCGNLKTMIAKQKQTLKHYQDIHSSSNLDIGKSKQNIAKYKSDVMTSQRKVKLLQAQLAVEQQKLTQTQKMMSLEHARVSKSNQNLKTVTKSVLQNEEQLIGSLSSQYDRMCSKTTITQPTKTTNAQVNTKTTNAKVKKKESSSGLVKQFYP
jgi:hypothetical protein